MERDERDSKLQFFSDIGGGWRDRSLLTFCQGLCSAPAEDQCLVILSRFYCIILRFCQIQKLWKSFLDFNNNIFLVSLGKGDCQVKALIQWLQLFRGGRLAAMSGRISFCAGTIPKGVDTSSNQRHFCCFLLRFWRLASFIFDAKPLFCHCKTHGQYSERRTNYIYMHA